MYKDGYLDALEDFKEKLEESKQEFPIRRYTGKTPTPLLSENSELRLLDQKRREWFKKWFGNDE